MTHQIILIPVLILIMGTLTVVSAQSLYKDKKAKQVGDVITIVLVENIQGSSSADRRANSNNQSSTGASFENDYIPSTDFFYNAEVDYRADKGAITNQSQLLSGSLSVRIEEITENGDLLVKGERQTEINGEKHHITISGYVRPDDIDTRNRVPSFRVAEANIVFMQEGGIEGMRKNKGIFGKVLGVVGAVSGLATLVFLGI